MLKKKYDFKFTKRELIYFLILFPFLKPESFAQISFLDNIFDFLRIISSVFMIYMIIKDKTFSKFFLSIITFEVILLLITFFKVGFNYIPIIKAVSIVLLCGYIETILKRDKNECLNVLNFGFGVLVFANLITMLLYKNGMYLKVNPDGIWSTADNWLLGFKNNLAMVLLPSLLISGIYSYWKYNKLSISFSVTAFAICLSLFLSRSSTMIIIGFLIIMYILFEKFILKYSKKIFNIKNYLILNITFFIGIVILRMQNIFSFFITNILNESITFNNRVYVWDNALKWIFKSPIFGYGFENSLVKIQKFGASTFINAHNQILEIMYQGGIILFISFLYFVYLVISKLLQFNSKISIWISFIMFLLFIIFQFEVYFTSPFVFLIFLFGYHVDFFIGDKDEI